jgi:hypothetical protein
VITVLLIILLIAMVVGAYRWGMKENSKYLNK